MGPVLYLLLCSSCIAQLVSAERFLVTAPSVFHVGVKEKVSVQVGQSLLNKPVTCHLEKEVGNVRISKQETVHVTRKDEIGILELEVPLAETTKLMSANGEPPYLNLVCNVGESKRQTARVLVSKHRGYIFIQTDQPMYNPTQKVQYRIFILDHAMRPTSKSKIHVYIINAEGNTVKKEVYQSTGAIFYKYFNIPDVSQPGVWKIKAHYTGDEENAAVREFKVQRFVLPTFGVSIVPATDYLLVTSDSFAFSVKASYSYGETISGGFHCRLGVKKQNTEDTNIKFIKGMEKLGRIKDGEAHVIVNIKELQQKFKSSTKENFPENEAWLYIAATVTDTKSGEVQESEILLPIVKYPYIVDLSRTRSHYIPKVPFNVIAEVRTPNGRPAKNIEVKIAVSNSNEVSQNEKTNNEGLAISTFNLKHQPEVISVKVTIDEFPVEEKKVFRPTSSERFLDISVVHNIQSPGGDLTVDFNVVSGSPEDGQIYYMIISKGSLKKAAVLQSGIVTTTRITVSAEWAPSFRLVGYYYDKGEIIADSVWIDVKDVCEGEIKVTKKDELKVYRPAEEIELDINVGTQSNVKVAIVAVDKAIYALNAQNKLTSKQVFSSMQSYDLGCSFGGGENTATVLNNAGLAFISHSKTVRSQMRIGFGCESGFRRQKRSINLQLELDNKKREYASAALQKCCHNGMTLIPMKLSCEERKKRVSRSESQECVEVFMKCCEYAVKLREQKRRDDMRSGHGRTASSNEFEDFFDNDVQYIRHSFPPSFEFKDFTVKGKAVHKLIAPDSITTWEIQVASLSSSHGFCVADPVDVRVFEELFISLRLPYSVKRNEQLAIAAVIYNYGKEKRELAVHMKQVSNLCSPGAASATSYVNITVPQKSSSTVTFSAVPLMEGEIPITLLLYDRDFKMVVDAIEKTLLVVSEGFQKREKGTTEVIFLDGKVRKETTLNIDGLFPDHTVPDSSTNLFVTLEEDGQFSPSTAMPLLSPSKVNKLIRAPTGCAEQTMIRMSPTALSIHYLDFTNRWLELPAGIRDVAVDFIQQAYDRILTYKKTDGSYGAWKHYPTSNWLTALVVKVLSLVANLQLRVVENQDIISQLEIRHPVNYLIEKQNADGSFNDPKPVIHREMQGGIGGIEEDASLTAFITIALYHSIPFLDQETDAVKSSITRATKYLLSRVNKLQRPFALAITTYCLSTCLEDSKQALPAWKKLKSLGKSVRECKVWEANEDMRLDGEKKMHLVPSAMALTIETTAYVLLSAVALKDFEEAKKAACFLSSQENYEGGFKSTQDTIVALEALSAYSLSKPATPPARVTVEFTTPGRGEQKEKVFLKNEEKMEVELKRLLGGNITAKFVGEGQAKMKVVKAYYAMDPYTNCDDLSIEVKIDNKVEYTAEITENYEYIDYESDQGERREEEDIPRSAIEWFDVRSRRRRDTEQSQKKENTVQYKVCVSYSLRHNISGMAIADITLLSGFEPVTEDLDKLKDLTDKYISHYEVSQGRVLLYFNEIFNCKECITFQAVQKVPIGLLQPAPAVFYDYYEPDRRCTVFYAAPKRSKMVSVLCSGDVCQCAERACFKTKKTFDSNIMKEDRFRHACFQPVVDYVFLVTVKSVEEASNFVLYSTNVIDVHKFNLDDTVQEGSNRTFVKRKHCKDQLEKDKTYLIMGKDGNTKDKYGQMQYLLDSNTWTELKPTAEICKASNKKQLCKKFKEFLKEYEVNGCNQ